MRAFWDLSTCRQFGMGIGPIPYNVIMDYARIHGLEDDIVPMFALVIRTMDGVYLEWEMAASKARAEANE